MPITRENAKVPKIAVEGTTITLECKGQWQWGTGKELEIEANGGTRSATYGGLQCLFPEDLANAIEEQIPGKTYKHSGATSPGTIGTVNVGIDPNTCTKATRVEGQSLATNKTTGTFHIMAGTPSVQGQTTDPKMVHRGTWRVKQTGQNKFTEDEGRRARCETETTSGKFPTETTRVDIKAEDEVDETREEEEDEDQYVLEVPVRMTNDENFHHWEEEIDGASRLALKLEIAQLNEGDKGIAGSFDTSLSIRKLFTADGSKRLAMTFPPARLDPGKPIWIRIHGTPIGGGHKLKESKIGRLAWFTITASEIRMVEPKRQGKKGSELHQVEPENAQKVWAKAEDIEGDGEQGRASAMMRSATDMLAGKNGWRQVEGGHDAPEAETVIRKPIEFSACKTEGEGTPRARKIAGPTIEIAPRWPGLLSCQALTNRIDSDLTQLKTWMQRRLDQMMLATKLEELRREKTEITQSEEIKRHVDENMELQRYGYSGLKDEIERSHRLVKRSAGSYRMTPATLFLIMYHARCREKAFLMKDKVETLMEIMEKGSGAGTEGSAQCESQLVREENEIRLLTGALALNWSKEDSEEQWATEVQRETRPEWHLRSKTVTLAIDAANTLSRVESASRRAGRLGGVFSKRGGDELLGHRKRTRWNDIISTGVNDAQQRTAKRWRLMSLMLPSIEQAISISRKSRKYILLGRRTVLPRQTTRLEELAREAQHNTKSVIPVAVATTPMGSKVKEILASGKVLIPYFFKEAGKNKLGWVNEQIKKNREFKKLQESEINKIIGMVITDEGKRKEFIRRMGKAADSVALVVLVISLADRVMNEDSRNDPSEYLEMLSEVMWIFEMGLRRVGNSAKRKIGLVPCIVLIQASAEFVKMRNASREDRDWDAVRHGAQAVLFICMLPPVMPALAALAGSALLATMIIGIAFFLVGFIQSGPPRDVEICLDKLANDVRHCVFGTNGFKELVEQRITMLNARYTAHNKPGQTVKSYEEIQQKWLNKVDRKVLNTPDCEKDAGRITATASIASMTFERRLFILNDSGQEPDDNWAGPLKNGRTGEGYRIVIPSILITGEENVTILLPEMSGDYSLAMQIERGETGGSKNLVVRGGKKRAGAKTTPLYKKSSKIGSAIVVPKNETINEPCTILITLLQAQPFGVHKIALPEPDEPGSGCNQGKLELLIATQEYKNTDEESKQLNEQNEDPLLIISNKKTATRLYREEPAKASEPEKTKFRSHEKAIPGKRFLMRTK